MDILAILLGAVMVLWGADKLTEGATVLAQKMNIPQIVIGLTIVALGTSMPEFFVSFVSALKGTADLAIGNIVGSNIFNVMAIVGIAAMVSPMIISKSTVKKDIPFALFASVALFVMSIDGKISRIDGILLLIAFGGFMWYTLRLAKTGEVEDSTERRNDLPKWKIAFFILIGLGCLIGGSNIFVDGATNIARTLGVSEAVIGLTIVACGTSLPELATSVVAARKGQSAIAIGNVIGSNVFNILLILGTTGTITPLLMSGITMIDMGLMLLSMVLLWLFSFTKYTLSRWEGALLTTIFCGYITWLVINV